MATPLSCTKGDVRATILLNRCQQHTCTNMFMHMHFTNTLTEQAGKALPEDVDPLILDRREKNVMFFHDETTFQSNENQGV